MTWLKLKMKLTTLAVEISKIVYQNNPLLFRLEQTERNDEGLRIENKKLRDTIKNGNKECIKALQKKLKNEEE